MWPSFLLAEHRESSCCRALAHTAPLPETPTLLFLMDQSCSSSGLYSAPISLANLRSAKWNDGCRQCGSIYHASLALLLLAVL